MDSNGKSFSLRYIGDRFTNARLPVDVLSDLIALRDLIAALAKHDFLQKNPGRQRIPRGFDKAISFALIKIDEGSAVPMLSLENVTSQQDIIGNPIEGIASSAFTRAVYIYDDATRDIFPQILPRDAIRALSKFGANIQDNERIEFQGVQGKNGNVVSIDFHTRKNLLTRLRETYTKEFEGVGKLTALDTSSNFIKVQTELYGELQLNLEDGTLPVERFDGYLHSLVEFSISIALDSHDKFKSVEEVHSVDFVQEHDEAVKNCLKRLQDLSMIEKGWLGNDQGEQVVHLAGLRAGQLVFMQPHLADLFNIFPTEEGGISLEFDKDDWSFAVEIMHDGKVEIDGVSEDGKVHEVQSFDYLSDAFFDAFDNMVSVVINDKN